MLGKQAFAVIFFCLFLVSVFLNAFLLTNKRVEVSYCSVYEKEIFCGPQETGCLFNNTIKKVSGYASNRVVHDNLLSDEAFCQLYQSATYDHNT